MKRRKALYSIGDLLVELDDNLNPITGIITDVNLSEYEEQYFYSIKWADLPIEATISEAILHWRVENSIWSYYGVILNEKK